MKVRVKTPSRIHITLIDLNGSIGRIDGGVGLTLESPSIELIGEKSESGKLKIKGSLGEIFRYEEICKKFGSISGSESVQITVNSAYRSHIGLGSGTQTSLAVGSVYNGLFDLKFSLKQIAGISGRGGTSGIGVAAFESGGFIVDGGHSTKEKNSFKPSSASKAQPPPLIFRNEFPDWKIVLLTPTMSGFSGRNEVKLFEENCPVPVEDVREISHLILLKMMPAVLEEDLDSFGDAIFKIQSLGFKKAEIDQYGNLLRDLMNNLREFTPAVGMSSTGPTVYAITDSNPKKIVREGVEYFKKMNIHCEFLITHAKNSGADIKLIEDGS